MSATSHSKADPPAGPTGSVQWFIGRDGQQFGPVTDSELKKLIELGHLRPTDLLWREGWADWRAAHILLPDASAASPRPVPVPPVTAPAAEPMAQRPRDPLEIRPDAMAVRRGPAASDERAGGGMRVEAARGRPTSAAPSDDDDDIDESEVAEGGGRGWKIAAAVLFFVAALAGAAWLYLPDLSRSLKTAAGAVMVSAPQVPASLPIAGFQADADATDRMLQSTSLFKTLKRTHPEWYQQRLSETSAQAKAGTSDLQILSGLMQSVVRLRRQHAENASAAPLGHLMAIGQSFVGNLALLKSLSADLCFAFISNGEAAPGIVELYQNKDHTALLQRQLVAVFEAVEEGRKTPRVYPVPKQSDYDQLVTELQARGWSQADIQTFSDSRALAKSPPDKVCSLVTQWFESQLSLKDPDIKLRLLVDGLRPMIAG